jgi:hypothetical protein
MISRKKMERLNGTTGGNVIDKSIRYYKGSNGPKPEPKPNGSKPPFNLDDWLETIDPGGWQDEESRKKITERRYASHDPDALAYEYWNERYLSHPLKNKFPTLQEFISWSLATEDQPFNRGGIASLKV